MDEQNEIIETPAAEESAPAAPAEKLFTESEVNEIIQKRLARERKKSGLSEESYTAELEAITADRDKIKADLETTKGELLKARHIAFIMSRGYSADEADYIDFKVSKIKDDSMTYEEALNMITPPQKQQTKTYDWSASVSGGRKPPRTEKDVFNDLIREAFSHG